MASEYGSFHDFRWENDPAFGIVHPSGCNICRHYMSHIAAAATDVQNHPTFKPALQLRDSQYNSQFLSGVVEGRRLQREHDIDQLYQLKDCRTERDEAVEQNEKLSAKLVASQEELELVKQQFHALQILFEEMAELNSSHLACERQGASFVSTHEEGNSQPTTIESHLPTPSHSTASSCSSDMAELPTPPTPILSQAQAPVPLPAVLVPTASHILPSDLATPTTVLEMQSLMSDGCRPGKTEALTKVRTLYTKALLTPRPHQNDPQQYLLSQWKGPQSGLKSSEEYTLRRSREPPATGEVFVDSSPSWGIGFVMNGRWLAWKFKDGWRSGGKENHWAEMVAVELGLRVAIASGGHAAPIMIRCDNVGVVQSLMTGKERDSERMEILRHIQQLCVTYNAQVTPRWIPTKDNPADGPSRGVFPSRDLLVSNPPPLPTHLTGFLEDPVGFSLLPQY